jgi:TIGR03009 family protein
MRRIGWTVGVVLLAASCRAVEDKPLPAPFQLTSDQQKSVDRLLARWEQWNTGLKTFECRFKRWTYDGVFGRPGQPTHVDAGTIKYAASGRGLFRVDSTEKDGKLAPIDDARAEHWLCDRNAIYWYNHAKKQVIAYKLPPELQTSQVVDGPLTFPFSDFSWLLFQRPLRPSPFSGRAAELNKQYYLREITPAGTTDQIWLEAFPRSTCVGADVQSLQLIFRAKDMAPLAMKVFAPNAKDSVVYSFFDVVVNGPSAEKAALEPTIPPGWQKVVEEPSAPALVKRPLPPRRGS